MVNSEGVMDSKSIDEEVFLISDQSIHSSRWSHLKLLAFSASFSTILFDVIVHSLNRGFYISAHVLLNLFNKLGKSE